MKTSVNIPSLILASLLSLGFMFLSFQSCPILEKAENLVYSLEMCLRIPLSHEKTDIAIVKIDDKSLRKLGTWPWPRHLIAEMIMILENNGAKLIGLDLLFNQKEQNQGLKEIINLHQTILNSDNLPSERTYLTWLVEIIKGIEKRLDNDQELARTVKKYDNIILPVSGKYGQYPTEIIPSQDSLLAKSSLRQDILDKQIIEKIAVNELIRPFPELSEAASGSGHINLHPQKAKEGRAHLPLINYRGNLIPSLPFRLAINYLNENTNDIILPNNNIKLNSKIIHLNKGELFILFKGAAHSFPEYSFVDILNGKKVAKVFNNKIVLIGFAARNGGVSINTPVASNMPRIELMANITQGFLSGHFLNRPYYMIYIESLFILLFGILAVIFLPPLNYFPRTMLIGTSIIMLFFSSLILFIIFNVWFKISYILFPVLIIYLYLSINDMLGKKKSLAVNSPESMETNRALGLSLQSQGLLDLALEKFRECPIDGPMKDSLYALGLEFERKRMLKKAIAVYEYINNEDSGFRDISIKIPQLTSIVENRDIGKNGAKKDGEILLSDDLEIIQTVGRYEILGEIAKGAMGIIYKGRDPKINRLIAIKTIRFSDDFEEEHIHDIKRRFFKEAEMAGKLSHPSIISIYDVGEDYDLTYMTMELLDGTDLEQFCQKDNLLPQRQTLDIIANIAEALDYAHNRGVIHRDIKPGNIMILTDGTIKVTDFGIAKAVSSSQTKSGVVLGTPNYMSPEQLSGRKIDGRSDIFSLGVLFYQLLTGELPFTGKNLAELFSQISKRRHPSPRNINPKVLKPCEQLLDKVLAKDPQKRFQRANEFAEYSRMIIEKIDQLRSDLKKRKPQNQ